MEGPEEEEEEVRYRCSVFIASLHQLVPVKWTSQPWTAKCTWLKSVELRTLWIFFLNHEDKFNFFVATHFILFETYLSVMHTELSNILMWAVDAMNGYCCRKCQSTQQ